jgi:hypothetical protein
MVCARSCLLLLLAFTGCATSLASFQPAHVPPKGHFGAAAGVDLALPVSTFTRTIDAAKTLADARGERMLTRDEQLQLLDAGTTIALSPPGAVTHLALTFTPFTRWEIGLFKASAAWRLAVRHQFLEQEVDGLDLTIGLGAQHFAYEFPVSDIIPGVEVEDFVRWNFDAPVTIGRHGDYFRVWGGPHLAASRYSTGVRLDAGLAGTDVATLEGSGLYFAGQAGAALGYKKVFLAFELTVARHLGSVDMSVQLPSEKLSRAVDLSTWVVFPGLAVIGEF